MTLKPNIWSQELAHIQIKNYPRFKAVSAFSLKSDIQKWNYTNCTNYIKKKKKEMYNNVSQMIATL